MFVDAEKRKKLAIEYLKEIMPSHGVYDFNFCIFDNEKFKDALSDAIDMVRWITNCQYSKANRCPKTEKEKIIYSQITRYFADLYREPNSDILSSLCGCMGPGVCNKKSCQVVWDGILESNEVVYVFLITQKILSEKEKEIYVKKEK